MASKINKILTNRSQEFSNDELANVSASLSAILGQGGGAPCASAWLPYVNSDGDISWRLTMTTIAPATANIMGPEGPSGSKGDPGDTPTFRINSSTNYWEVSYDDGSTWTSLDTSATGPKGDTGATGPQGPDGPQGPAGANGKDGTNGTNGADGISPTFTVTQITSGHSVTISGAQGSTTFNVLDGANGKDGKDGAAGANGISPTFTVTQITSGHSVTISGAQGSTAFNVLDGANGKDGANGTNGTNGKDGADGFSPTMTFTEAATSVSHKNGGTIVTFTYGASGSQTTAYTAWNGNDGSGGGGSSYTAGEGIDIDNDVISFSGAQVAAQEYVLAGNGTVNSPFNTSSFYEDYLDNLAAINGDVAVVSAAITTMGGAIKLVGNASVSYINGLSTGSYDIGNAFILTTTGTITGYDAAGSWIQVDAHVGDMAVLGRVNSDKTVSLLTTTPNLTQYAKLNQRTIVKAGVGVTVSHTENSDGAVEYTVNTVGGGGEGTLSAYTVTCSGDNRFDFERSVDPVTSAINYNMTTTMPNFINVTALPGALTANSYYFIYEE